jgi:hypothetical protein
MIDQERMCPASPGVASVLRHEVGRRCSIARSNKTVPGPGPDPHHLPQKGVRTDRLPAHPRATLPTQDGRRTLTGIPMATRPFRLDASPGTGDSRRRPTKVARERERRPRAAGDDRLRPPRVRLRPGRRRAGRLAAPRTLAQPPAPCLRVAGGDRGPAVGHKPALPVGVQRVHRDRQQASVAAGVQGPEARRTAKRSR